MARGISSEITSLEEKYNPPEDWRKPVFSDIDKDWKRLVPECLRREWHRIDRRHRLIMAATLKLCDDDIMDLYDNLDR